jgi:hypothetical protein
MENEEPSTELPKLLDANRYLKKANTRSKSTFNQSGYHTVIIKPNKTPLKHKKSQNLSRIALGHPSYRDFAYDLPPDKVISSANKTIDSGIDFNRRMIEIKSIFTDEEEIRKYINFLKPSIDHLDIIDEYVNQIKAKTRSDFDAPVRCIQDLQSDIMKSKTRVDIPFSQNCISTVAQTVRCYNY